MVRVKPHESIASISKHLGIDITDTSARIIGTLNIESQRKRQKNIIVNSTGHSIESFMHYEHVNPDNQQHDPNIHNLIFTSFGELLNEDGYLK